MKYYIIHILNNYSRRKLYIKGPFMSPVNDHGTQLQSPMIIHGTQLQSPRNDHGTQLSESQE